MAKNTGASTGEPDKAGDYEACRGYLRRILASLYEHTTPNGGFPSQNERAQNLADDWLHIPAAHVLSLLDDLVQRGWARLVPSDGGKQLIRTGAGDAALEGPHPKPIFCEVEETIRVILGILREVATDPAMEGDPRMKIGFLSLTNLRRWVEVRGVLPSAVEKAFDRAQDDGLIVVDRLSRLGGSMNVRACRITRQGREWLSRGDVSKKEKTITLTQAVKVFCASRPTLERAIKSGKIHSHRKPGGHKTSKHLLRASELEHHYERRPDPQR